MRQTTHFDYQKSIFEILNISELGLLILDENNRVIWSNGQFALWSGLETDDLLGKSWMALPLEAVNERANLYCLMSRERSQALHLQHWQALLPSDPNLTVHYFRAIALDIHERVDAPQVLGLPQRPNWAQFLDYEVSRSRRYDNPLTLLKVKLVVFGDPDSLLVTNEINQLVSEVLKDELRWADMIGHSETGEFLLVLPETNHEATESLKDKVTSAVKTRMKNQFPEQDFDLVFGQAHWQKGDSSAILLARTRDSLIERLQTMMQRYQ